MPFKMKFTLDFQRNILAAIFLEESGRQYWGEVMTPESFSDELLIGVAQAVVEFHSKHNQIPTQETLNHEIKSYVAPGRRVHEYADEIQTLYSKVGGNTTYYQSKAVEFARSQAVAQSLRDSVPMLELGELEEIGKSVAEALKVGDGSLANHLYSYLECAQERTLGYLHNGTRLGCVPTGFGSLDRMMGGGLAAGELGVVVGLPKHGKTTTLVNLGANALLAGKNVLYFTLELSKKMIAAKFDTKFFGDGIPEIKKNPAKFASEIMKLKAKLMSHLYIAEFPTKSLTLDRMESLIQKAPKIDLVLMDYGQLLRPSVSRGEHHRELTDIYEGLRHAAGVLKVAIWSAHQANRPGTGSKVIRSEHIAGDFNIIAISDIGVSVNQTDEELTRNKMRLFVMGNRLGPSGDAIDCDVNWKTATIHEAAEINLG